MPRPKPWPLVTILVAATYTIAMADGPLSSATAITVLTTQVDLTLKKSVPKNAPEGVSGMHLQGKKVELP